MGFGSPAVLVLLLQRKKPLAMKHYEALARGMGLSADESPYFQAMIHLANARTEDERRFFEACLVRFSPGPGFVVERVEDDGLLSHWLHAALLEMSEIDGLTLAPDVIAGRLADQASADLPAIEAALAKLASLKLLVADESGRLRKVADRITAPTTRSGASRAGASAYYRQVSALAHQAADLAADEREFQCFALAFERGKLPLVKDMIREFRNQLSKVGANGEADSVYQANLQFFPLIATPKP